MTWILTHSGQAFDLNKLPTPDMIDPFDIAHSLSMQARFNGHTSKFYSVAQHSLLVAELVPDKFRLAALLHDAAEAYIGDIITPLKHLIPEIKKIEDGIWWAIAERFDIPFELPEEVKQADLVALATEKRDLMPLHPRPWPSLDGIVPMKETIIPLGPGESASSYRHNLQIEIFRQKYGHYPNGWARIDATYEGPGAPQCM